MPSYQLNAFIILSDSLWPDLLQATVLILHINLLNITQKLLASSHDGCVYQLIRLGVSVEVDKVAHGVRTRARCAAFDYWNV